MPITFPLPVQWETTFQFKYLWNSSTVECLSVQTYPFKNQWGRTSNNDLPRLVTSIGAKQRERKNNLGSFFLCVFRVNAACQKGDLLRPQRKTFSRWWKHDWATWVAQPNFCSTVTVITLGALWHPTLVKKTPGKEKSHKYQQKTHFEAKGMRPGRAELPVHHSEVLWMATKAPRVRLCGIWTLPRANATSPCQVLGRRQENPPTRWEISTKLEHKGHIHGYTKPKRLDGIGLNGVYYVALMPQGLKQRWKLGLRFTFQEKGRTTVTLGENTVALRLNLSFWLSFYPQCIAKWIKDTLRSSMNAFCIPLSSCSTGFVGNVTHHRISNVLKGCLEKKYPLIGFTHPLTAEHWK